MTDYHRGRVRTADQLDLVWQSWTPASPRGVIVIIHGLAEHSGRYRDTAEFLSANGWAVYACDLRAHGLSPDPPKAGRVHVDRFEDYFMDVDALTGLASEKHKELPLYLLGHSMGGLISIRYCLEKPAGLAGAVISSPALGTHPEFKPPLFLKLMVSILSQAGPAPAGRQRPGHPGHFKRPGRGESLHRRPARLPKSLCPLVWRNHEIHEEGP